MDDCDEFGVRSLRIISIRNFRHVKHNFGTKTEYFPSSTLSRMRTRHTRHAWDLTLHTKRNWIFCFMREIYVLRHKTYQISAGGITRNLKKKTHVEQIEPFRRKTGGKVWRMMSGIVREWCCCWRRRRRIVVQQKNNNNFFMLRFRLDMFCELRNGKIIILSLLMASAAAEHNAITSFSTRNCLSNITEPVLPAPSFCGLKSFVSRRLLACAKHET